MSSPAASEAPARPSFKRLIGGRDFRLLWGGEAVSLIGDQFELIALPWLVVTLTAVPWPSEASSLQPRSRALC